jgi:hypothetical protein
LPVKSERRTFIKSPAAWRFLRLAFPMA